MKFRALQENLRKALWQRINDGDLTGLRLAEQTGFKQAHISNFLNRKRGLSLEGMDKVLNAQHLSVLDLLDPAEVNKRASLVPPAEDEFDSIVVAEPRVAASEPLIMSMHVQEILKFRKGFVRRLKDSVEGDRAAWQRFVAIKPDAQQCMRMYPRMLPGAILVIDRHYNSLVPYRKGEPNMYAVLKDEHCTVTYLEVVDRSLLLRPHNQAHPVQIVTVDPDKRPSDYIVGRICYVGVET